MKRRECISIFGGIAAGLWRRRRTIIAAMAAMVLLPIGVSDAGRRSHNFKSSSKHVTSPKRHTVKLAALGPVAFNPSALKPVCHPSKFRIVLDVGHTAESEGAISARNVAEFVFNLRLAQRIEEKLKAEGFALCTIEIEPYGDAVRLSITHTMERADSKFIEAVAGGWPKILSNLKSLMETGSVVLTEADHSHDRDVPQRV